jgi:putative glutamine amidotransferase
MPVIGVTCYLEPVHRPPWVDQPSAVLPRGYLDHLAQAGALAVLLPPREDATEEMADSVLDRLDGLVIAGGADVESSRYGEDPHHTAQNARRDRDEWEIALARAARARDLPVLGICRGMQVLAVAAGGRLEQHLPDVVGHHDHSPTVGAYAWHPVRVEPGTRLAGLLGDGPMDDEGAPTYHHQAVDPQSLQDTGFRPAAWHEDGTLEAMEDPDAAFLIAVQWHPEAGTDPRLFDALVGAAGSGVGVSRERPPTG